MRLFSPNQMRDWAPPETLMRPAGGVYCAQNGRDRSLRLRWRRELVFSGDVGNPLLDAQ